MYNQPGGYTGAPFGQQPGGSSGGFGAAPSFGSQPFGAPQQQQQQQQFGQGGASFGQGGAGYDGQGAPFGQQPRQPEAAKQAAPGYGGAMAPVSGAPFGQAPQAAGGQAPQAGFGFSDPAMASQAVGAAAAMFAGDSRVAQQLLEQQSRSMASAWLPGVAAGWGRLRVYFAVSHGSVAAKLRAVLFPFAKRHWRRKRAEELDGGDPRAAALHGHGLPVHDENAPDGYVPLVAFVTFALVAGYVRGSRGTFTPEVLASIFSWCAGLQMLEIALYSLGLYLLGAHNVPVLDVACFTGYKYVALSINAIAHFFGGEKAYYAALFWTGLSASYFMLKTMAQAVPAELESSAARREIVVLVFGVLQGLSIWVLGRSA